MLLLKPRITSIEQLQALGLTLNDFTGQDLIAEFLMLVRTKDLALAESEDLSRSLYEQRARLKDANDRLAQEMAERTLVEEALAEREAAYRALVNSLNDVVFQTDAEGRLRFLNPAWAELTGQSAEQALGQSVSSLLTANDRTPADEAIGALLRGETTSCHLQVSLHDRDGGLRHLDLHARPIASAARATHGLAGTLTDITDRLAREASLVEAHAALLRASRLKDEFLSSMSHELRTPLNKDPRVVSIESDQRRLKQILVNLLSNAVKFTPTGGRVRLEVVGDAVAGEAAFHVVDTGIGIPLAEQPRLFTPFMQVDSSLSRQYNGTGLGLALVKHGWVRALDLRDHETEGHTQRVTTMTVRLARQVGITGDACEDIRRGALLHDIGKIGVPDGILHKPGPLSDDEWVLMRQHPDHARTMLEPIAHLRAAIDIPYGHHERWDGTGYPQRLQGTAIPFAARLFALVDTFDALTSARPYKRAWSVAEALAYVTEQAGAHFDPSLAAIFVEMVDRGAFDDLLAGAEVAPMSA